MASTGRRVVSIPTAPPSPSVEAPRSETLKKHRKCAATVAARACAAWLFRLQAAVCLPLNAGRAGVGGWLVQRALAEVRLPRSCRFAGGHGQPAGRQVQGHRSSRGKTSPSRGTRRVSSWLPQLLAKGADDAATPGRRDSGGGSGPSQTGHPATGRPVGGTSRWRRRGFGRHGCEGRWPLGFAKSWSSPPVSCPLTPATLGGLPR